MICFRILLPLSSDYLLCQINLLWYESSIGMSLFSSPVISRQFLCYISTNGGRSEDLGSTACTMTVVGGRQEYAPCRIFNTVIGGRQEYTPCKIFNTVIGGKQEYTPCK